MTDLLLAAAWLAWLALGLGVVLALHRRGLPGSTARDLVHVGAGSWVLGWPWWQTSLVPVSIVLGAAALVPALPHLSGRLASALPRALAEGDERWSGVALYTASVALFTILGLSGQPFPAGAALLALALGDGLGGAIGSRWGRRRYRLPWTKARSVEGSLAVALFATLGVLLAAATLGAAPSVGVVLGAGVLAALAEAASPRASDNLVLPLVVWGWLSLLT